VWGGARATSLGRFYSRIVIVDASITTHEGCEPDTIQEGDSETESFNLSEIIGAGAAERSSSSGSSGQT
jgi:hypothetical protein